MGTRRPKRVPASWHRLLPVLILCVAVGCVPEGAFGQVLGENMLLTVASTIQTITWVFFNSLFGLI